MKDPQPDPLTTRPKEPSRMTQIWVSLGTLGAALLTLSVLASNPIEAQKSGSNPAPAKLSVVVKKGHDLFAKNCAPCHGLNGKGAEAPPVQNLKMNDAGMTKVIQNGSPGEMPAFAGKLKDADIKAILAFLRSIKK